MGWFWSSDSTKTPGVSPSANHAPATCPPPKQSSSCPVDHSKWASSSSCSRHSNSSSPFNPRNNMPALPNTPSSSGTRLSTAREMSTIPMNPQGDLWEYPSPQQMFNAMNRKGFETNHPEDVPAMVAVHNWINEGSWDHILKWERKYFPYIFLFFARSS